MADLPSIRSVMPWWYVGALALSFLVALLLASVANLVLAAPLWTGVIGTTIRDRRRGTEQMLPRQEAVVAMVADPGPARLAALLSQVWPFQHGAFDARVLIGGAVAIAVSGALFLLLRIRGDLRRRRGRDA
ncbi:hypothetical protein [Clavibacter zhangzhiyongii]|uniref:hypothetical protein n=1 Tax=Clavibacter zhangzhiyongii TaxID=2768071 RepID=UPI0019560300|nr:hypothetical protein [Clavibacter zhangzhiyongii]MBM7024290.1 hypothetical protein [Clavibacter zhangzhiyongii]